MPSTPLQWRRTISHNNCQKLNPRRADQTTRWETHRVIVYNQAIHKYSRCILIGPGYLNELQRRFLSAPWSPFKRERIRLLDAVDDFQYLRGPVFILIAYVAACSWQSMLNNIEDHLFLVRAPPDYVMAEEAYEDTGRFPSRHNQAYQCPVRTPESIKSCRLADRNQHRRAEVYHEKRPTRNRPRSTQMFICFFGRSDTSEGSRGVPLSRSS